MQNEDDYNSGYETGYDEGYDKGFSEGEKYQESVMQRSYENDLEDYKNESDYQLRTLQNDYDKRMEVLLGHLREKDSEIEEYLTQIKELRKANEELQRTIKINSR